jgi:16S rRNA (adenine1518-N6/adenine1519-N6)-dimethyltransferase
MNKDQIKLLFTQLDFTPKKKRLGQNFLIDDSVLKKIIKLSNVSNDDMVLEVGAGLGALTDQLIKKSKMVYAYELDPILYKYLEDKYVMEPFIKVINKDILNAKLPPHNKVVSNPPYSITGPLLEKLFFHFNPPEGTLIIEKKIADRIFTQNNYQTFSRISVTVNSFMEPITQQNISQNAFYPRPKIKLSLIQIKPKASIHLFLKEDSKKQFYLEFIAGIMPYKNKDVVNAIGLFLKNQYSGRNIQKEAIKDYLEKDSIQNKKISQLNFEQFPPLAEKIFDLIKKYNQ